MAVNQEKNKKKWTRDGRSWRFKIRYTALTGERKVHASKMFATKKDAQQAEREFIASLKDKVDDNNMRFKDLYLAYYEHQRDKVKETTFDTYIKRVPYLSLLDNIKLVDFNSGHFEMWKKEVNNKTNINTRTKNDLLKFLKAILNFGSKWYNFNFSSTYKKMTNFTNPSEIQKPMDFYTYDEFMHFISFETDLKYICLFKTLYYCALRNGEMRGLQWQDIDFERKELRINKHIPTFYSRKEYKITTTKTKSSNRVLPIPNSLFEDLQKYYEQISKFTNFDKSWFVFGDALPIVADNPSARQSKICELAGLKKIRLHDFRHSCASLLINNRATVPIVSQYLGHSKIEETLSTYTHMFESSLKEVVNLINDL